MLSTGIGCIGIKFEEMGDYVYLGPTEAVLLVNAIKVAAEHVLEQEEDRQ